MKAFIDACKVFWQMLGLNDFDRRMCCHYVDRHYSHRWMR